MSKEFEFLNKSHPDMVDVWRYDQDERSLEGFKTARTILANRLGVAPRLVFLTRTSVFIFCLTINRDLISLQGLTLVSGRHLLAGCCSLPG